MADDMLVLDGNNASVNVSMDDLGARKVQRVKIQYGLDGSGTDVSDSSPLPTKSAPVSAGGCAKYKRVSTASTNAATIKSSPGQIYAYHMTNKAGTWAFVKLYNKASNPSVGSDTPDMTLGLPPGGGATENIPQGVEYTVGIALAITGDEDDADTTAIAAGDVVVNFFYK